MEADEYEEMRYETVKQLEEFQSSLDNISNVTLKSDLERFKQVRRFVKQLLICVLKIHF